MQSSLAGRLRNTPLPYSNGLLPLFEAVVNSIHGIEDAGLSPESGKISIQILRKDKQPTLRLEDEKKKPGPDAREEIAGFKITDNGIGFNDANMQSFETLDSELKASKGCRGIGRLLWLKAFNKVKVESVYGSDAEGFKSRQFTFTAGDGVKRIDDGTSAAARGRITTVHLEAP